MRKAAALFQYCDRYAEPIAATFSRHQASLLSRVYDHVVCIPAYDESSDFVAPLLNSISGNVLVILVLNAPVGAEFTCQQQRTQSVLLSLTASRDSLTLVSWTSQVDLLVVDCCTQGRQLPLREGVGLARKIAGDLAVTAIAHQKVNSPWIHCTDADVQLPASYFSATETVLEQGGCAAVLYPFRHAPAHDSILQYEILLRYYALQLDQVRSPYAFQTVGSSMAAYVDSYVAVRGFPKRNAAEDFYILNKLAKTGIMIRLKGDPLVLSSRRSHRVPFGTGAAMNRLAQDPIQLLYNPEIFWHLSQWFQHLDRLWEDRDRVHLLGLEAWWQRNPLDCDAVFPILMEQGLAKVLLQAYRQCRDRPHFLYYVHVWFDAFRTLRFIHGMRDRGFPSMPIAKVFSRSSDNSPASRSRLCERLYQQELDLSFQVGPTQFIELSKF